MSSSGKLDPDEAEERASRALTDAFTVDKKAASAGAQFRRQFGSELTQAALAVIGIAVGTFLLGNFIGFGTALTLFVVLAVGAAITSRIGGFSIPFALSAVAVVLVVGQFLPTWATEPFTIFGVLFEQVTGLPVRQIDAVEFAVITAGVIGLMWVLDIRIFSAFRRSSGRPEAVNPDKVANRLVARVEGFAEDWFNISRAFVFLAFSLVVLALGVAAGLGGDIAAEWLAEAPVLAAGVFNWLVGFLALGGEVPIVGDWPVIGPILDVLAGLGATGWLLLAGGLLAAGVVIRDAME